LPLATIWRKDGRLHYYVQENISRQFKMNAPVRPALAMCATAPSFPRGPTGSPRHQGQTLPIRRSPTSYSTINRYSQEKPNMRRARFACFRPRTDDFGKDKKDMLLQSRLDPRSAVSPSSSLGALLRPIPIMLRRECRARLHARPTLADEWLLQPRPSGAWLSRSSQAFKKSGVLLDQSFRRCRCCFGGNG